MATKRRQPVTVRAEIGLLTPGERGGLTHPLTTMPTRGCRTRRPAERPVPRKVMSSVPHYEFIVRAQPDVDAHTLESTTGLRCTPSDRTTRLDGELVDRAALHGVIEGLYRLGLDLLAVERSSSRHAT
jgi:hypothetical protein